MIILSNSTAQTIPAGESLAFDTVVLHTGCNECHRGGSAAVKLRANGIYEVSFGGNIGGAADTLTLALQLGGETLRETTMTSVPAAATEFNNVGTTTAVRNCCGDYDRITVTNTGTVPVIVSANANLFVRRIA